MNTLKFWGMSYILFVHFLDFRMLKIIHSELENAAE